MPFSLYVHFPFCSNKCSYCDFYKELYDRSIEKRFFEALRIETELAAEQFESPDREIGTIFVGGGTPSLMNLDSFAGWLEQVKRLFYLPAGIEFSVETNPESVRLDNLKRLQELGVNRPVFGVQSFQTKLLKLLNRRHIPHHSQRAVYFANVLGFTNFGVDIIFGLPGQTTRMLAKDLDQIIDMDPPHISFYQLTVEEGTPLAHKVEAGELRIPDQELMLAMYRGGYDQLAEAGYVRYEVSSFAKPGFECRHNQAYWDGTEYLGLGPSAHSFVNGQRFLNVENVDEYLDSLKAGKLPRVFDESGLEERMVEAIMLGLRTSRGVSHASFARRFGRPLEDRLDNEQYNHLRESGHLIEDRTGIRLSESGFYLADEITRRLLK